jgi:molybdopterin synthase catalytic subunit
MPVVHVRLFASLQEAAGAGTFSLEMPEGATVGDLLTEIGDRHAGLAPRLTGIAVAVNRRLAHPSQPLAPEDEVALLPPVSGG